VIGVFVRLKLRLLRNRLRGNDWARASFIVGAVITAWVTAAGFAVLASPPTGLDAPRWCR
jgi:hypothetical protein